MYLTCQYNGNDLYSSHWDLCTIEDGLEDRVINCPIRIGRRKFVKELKIPNYLPKVQTFLCFVYCKVVSFHSVWLSIRGYVKLSRIAQGMEL